MEFLKNFGLILCTSSVLCALLSVLTPARRLGKTVRMVIGVFMTLVVAGQVAAVDFDALAASFGDPAAAAPQESPDSYEALLAREIEARVSRSLTDTLTAAGFTAVRAAEVSVHIGGEGGIYCDKASLYLAGGDQSSEDRARQIVQEQCGCEPEIYYEY